ncbi:MAG: electron transfer flavoprotein subunit alpha/FixB family protein [Syntrophobacteraceae bacterium]
MMSRPIYVYLTHHDGTIDDSALEMISAASRIDPDIPVTAIAFGFGDDLAAACRQAAQYYREVWKIEHEKLTHPDAEVIRRVLVRILPKGAIVLIPHEHFGMDLSPGLSILLETAYLSDVVDFEAAKDDRIRAVRQEYNGSVSTHVDCDLSNGAVINVRPGIFKKEEGQGVNGLVIDKTEETFKDWIPETRRRFLEIIKSEAGEVDITQSEVLVSVGRGIQDQENLEIIFDLARAVGGDVSCSRPIVDAKWLPRERQVGNSGKTVKPKVYMALGISGSFQHIAGIKGNPFIVAINKNPQAPFFQIADVAVVADILDFLPRLTAKINETREKK